MTFGTQHTLSPFELQGRESCAIFLPSPVTLLTFYSLLNSDCDQGQARDLGRQVQKEIIITEGPERKKGIAGKERIF
jgi:hypothetical protein